MRRIKVILAVVAAVATMVVLAAPTMAQSQGFNISGSGSGDASGISGSSFSGGSIGGNSVGGAGGGSIDLDGSGGRGVTLVGGSGDVEFDDHDIVVGSHRFDFDDEGDHIRSGDIVDRTNTGVRTVHNTVLNDSSCTWVQVPTAWLDLYEWIVNPVEVSPGWWWGCGWRIF